MNWRTITESGFVLLAGYGTTLEFAARREASRIPTAGHGLGALMRTPPGRACTLLAWCWLGWHFFAH